MSAGFDVIVAGGGISGTMAAIAAAREGARTLLIERYAALGGMATLGLVQPITTWGLGQAWVVGGTGRRVLEGMIARHPESGTELTRYGPTCDAEHLKRELEEQALAAGVSPRYHSWIAGVEREGERLTGLRVLSKGGEAVLRAGVFVDATGDGDLAAGAGLPFEMGSQGITLMFVLAGIDRARCPEREEMARLYQEAGPASYRGLCIFWGPRPDGCYVNMTEDDGDRPEDDRHRPQVEGLDACDPEDLTRATIECRRQAWQILETFRAHIPGFERAYIAQTAPALGVRESRHVHGLYRLTGEDVEAGRHFEDVIARAGCPVDIHGSDQGGRGAYHGLKRSYAIPYRCLVTPEVANLVLTGRCISADAVAHSSLRRMAPGFALGEAAGIAAAQALAHGDARTLPIAPLQATLRGYGAILEPE